MRQSLLNQIAARLAGRPSRAIIAIDGVDGSGKTVFSDALAETLRNQRVEIVRASVDGFHHPRAKRYARGNTDPLGYFYDSYDYLALRRHLIDPFRDGRAEVSTSMFDFRTDQPDVRTIANVSADAVLVLDGIFLHRDELSELWDISLFLDVPFEETYMRMAVRDGCTSDPYAPGNRRYLQGQTFYLAQCDPRQCATMVIDNTDYSAPFIVSRSEI